MKTEITKEDQVEIAAAARNAASEVDPGSFWDEVAGYFDGQRGLVTPRPTAETP
jgi:hypothetical protein